MVQENIRQEGVVQENLPNTLFRVKFPDETVILAHLSGRMRLHYIKILPGDRVIVEITPYDKTKGRIVQRLKQ
ncbi:translation initiation factor IF-1 [Candidatus Azambacteria bacterium RIFCSPHIGHO2_02_FULL_52_12]|uniref:Translation initiation factor IF-1 n=1 Tax=Candidatus Azambacteria bacterium RIFCSPLOWO2_01_FULL_46_25 TaxID=1797298 RepID=A0A1F5BTH9_9BACT|nr:MAG: translation initiation factor IF-1 [Candidatus Azambacteria bacterium RIFCSPHIGHO2_02_FULL_52_12]OGD33895.1 MAG: translation initiation factor IF-1 [Candidatus Azambacteria bacterium RIFCSPLOWO2_01_FULL_46_25]OGD37955.1 MAG: translation initiation factor IF-1 [Candidatus Azambacteria bacterium RIFCSPHIGHO2_01_FULL_51_74]